MNISRSHPCNAFSWLFCSSEIAGPAMQQQLRFRDEEVAKDPHFSGEPPAFRPWAIAQVRQYVHLPQIAQQIETRRADLQLQQRRLEERVAGTLAAMEREAADLADRLALLDELEAAA